MTDNGDTLEARVAALETEMAVVRGEAAAARALAAGADRDVAEYRAEMRSHTRVLNALRETQIEHGTRLDELTEEVRGGFATVNTGMAQIVTLLESLGPADS
jgi:uncharacterized protein involved in exopolysaccharide biosynthesis